MDGGGSCSRPPHVCHMQTTGHLRDLFFTGHKFCGFFDNFFFGGGLGGVRGGLVFSSVNLTNFAKFLDVNFSLSQN